MQGSKGNADIQNRHMVTVERERVGNERLASKHIYCHL